jgi:hypothetical protein
MSKTKTVVGERVITPRARLSYPSLFKPDTGGQYSDDKYKATLLFEKGNAEIVAGLKLMKAACVVVAKQAFGDEKGITLPFRAGDEKEQEAYKGMIYITAKSKYRPGVVGQDPKVELTEESDVYGGCYVRASLVPFSYQAGTNKGVSFRLCNVQKLADGDPFTGSKVSAEADFEPVGAVDETTPFDENEDNLGL